MTPAEQLAAARANVVGPYLPAREEWLRGWAGYVMWSVSPNTDALGAAIATGFVLNGRAELRLIDGTTMQRPDRIRLDVHRPEVRDHLVRLGCPEWARDVPAAVWCWGMWGHPPGVLLEWHQAASGRVWHRAGLAATQTTVSVSADGWRVLSIVDESGPETGDLGRACADLAAIHAGCIVRVEGGWLVPLPGGGIGFFAEVSHDE